MEVTVLSNTIQKFNGESYYLCGMYFQRKGKRLHRTVWEYHNGKIPHGYHVHHKDGNRANNNIDNLALMRGTDHLSGHMSQDDRKEKSRKSIRKAMEKAPEWHRSAEGRKWHSEHAKDCWKHAKPHEEICAWCGCVFDSRAGKRSGDRFCCNNHKAAALRWRRSHEGQVNYPGRKG